MLNIDDTADLTWPTPGTAVALQAKRSVTGVHWSQSMTATRRPILGLAAVLFLLGTVAAVPPAGSARGQAAKLPDDIPWLEERSMLRQAREAAATVSGRPNQWRHPYGSPQPRDAVRHASVWLL